MKQPRIRIKWEIRLESGGWLRYLLRSRTFPWTQEGYDKALALYEKLSLDPRGTIHRLRMMQPKPWKYGIPKTQNGPTPEPCEREVRETPTEVRDLPPGNGGSALPERSSTLCGDLRVDRLEVPRANPEGIQGEVAFRRAARLLWSLHRMQE